MNRFIDFRVSIVCLFSVPQIPQRIAYIFLCVGLCVLVRIRVYLCLFVLMLYQFVPQG